MTEQTQALNEDELAQEGVAELPDREAMSLVNLNAAIPVNAGLAANVLSDGANATGDATQQTPIGESNL
jgi:hypothetical protein